ncbi:MAG: class I SAM-dependent methyltransferase [Hoeflea sp.]|uniref:class I SAM-dependent methyltransferase n=1 Tax=Hoeflea sp. TaxID=1940281 RepID=UPI003EF7B2BE
MGTGLWNELVFGGLLKTRRQFVNIGLAPSRFSGMEATQREAYATLADFVKSTGAADGECLEICAGFGSGIEILASAASWKVVGADASRLATNRAKARGANVRRARLEALPFADRNFANVVGVESVIVLDDPTPCLIEIARVLRPGGALSIAEFRKCSIQNAEKYIGRLAKETGLELKIFEDVTARALASVLETATERQSQVDAIPRPFRRAAREMAGLPGTVRYQEWCTGERCYYLARLEKRAD